MEVFERSQPVQMPVAMSNQQVIQALKDDAEFFIQFYLGDEIDTPVPDFHVREFEKMTSAQIPLYACAIPRDHAKTTLAKLACVYMFLFHPTQFILYVSNTFSIAAPAVFDIIAFMHKPNSVTLFGAPTFETEAGGKGIYIFVWNGKLCILRAMGAGQQVRGMNVRNIRPQTAIVDDLEDNDNIADEELYKKLKNWFWGRFYKALDKRTKRVIQIGNLLMHRQMLREHIESKYWVSTRYGAIKRDGTPLWPQMFTIEKLKAEYNMYVENGEGHTWMAEMMNMPMPAGAGLIRSDQIKQEPGLQPGDIEFGCITIDPAISDKKWAHKCVVYAHGFREGKWHSLEHEATTGTDPIELFRITVDMASRWNIFCAGIESVAYQAAIKPVFDMLAAQYNLNYMIFINIPASFASKTPRLFAWSAMIASGDYILNYEDQDVVDQLLAYNPKAKENDDDIIDGGSYLVTMTQEYMFEITQTFDLTAKHTKPQTLYQTERLSYG